MPSTPRQWMMGLGLPLIAAAQASAEDQFGYTHESYVEDHGRMTVQTDTIRGDIAFAPWLNVTAQGVYDGISGATPTGAPAIDQVHLRDPRTHQPIPNTLITGFTRSLDAVSGASPTPSSQGNSRNTIPLANSHDIRRGIDVTTAFIFGPHRIAPEISYSKEADYDSYAFALNYSLELNEKNTVLNAGWSHSYDRALANNFTYITDHKVKNSDDFILGVTQLLGPGTIASVNGTISHQDGYLNDPYRSVLFEETRLDANAKALLEGEKRPSTRDSQSLMLTMTQAITPLDASVEGTYRYYHDSYGIIANTASIAWYQKIAQAGVVSPSFRYYRQGAANFYGIQFQGDPKNDPARAPQFYSSDYRLSFLETFTLGLEATIKLQEHCDLRLGYQRYWMRGLDHQTQQSVYPSANIFTIGLNVAF